MAPESYQYDVFLSHNSQDKPAVRQLAERLRQDGLRVWFDEWIIRVGDDIYLSIEQGLQASRVLVLVMSEYAFGSGWVDLERSTSLFRDPSNRKRSFVPLLLSDCNLPDTLKRYKYIDFRKSDELAYQDLFDACRPFELKPESLSGSRISVQKVEETSVEKGNAAKPNSNLSMREMPRIFLCHANEDKPKVEALYEHLHRLGFNPWMDRKDLIPGQNWQREIPLVLRSSALVLVCLSKNVGRPGYVQREFKLVVDTLQEVPEEIIHTIPVRLERCSVPEQFRSLQWCDLFEADGHKRLEQAIRYGFEQRGLAVPEPTSAADTPLGSGAPAAGDRNEASKWRTNAIGMAFVQIPAGTFWMGSPESDNWKSSDERWHKETIEHGFEMAIHPVTYHEFKRYAETEGRCVPNDGGWGGGQKPVTNITYEDATAFANWLCRITGKRYQLPTEAEWEYAARAGTSTRYAIGDEIDVTQWHFDAGKHVGPIEVDNMPGNSWGIKGCHGNVWELTGSKYTPGYDGSERYLVQSAVDTKFAVRGGSGRVL